MYEKILIDGNFIARKIFAVNKMLNATVGERKVQTGLTHGFLLWLAGLRRNYPDGKIILCWDSGHTLRRKIDPEYKTIRREKNKQWDDRKLFNEHVNILRFFLKLTGITQAKSPGNEGDDLIYTLARSSDGKALIVSSDHDFHQALDKWTHQLIQKNKAVPYILTPARLECDTGLSPDGYGHMMTLAGCSGDGIKGAPRVGKETATKWIMQWPNLVPAILGQNDTLFSHWLPEVDKKNKVTVASEYFPLGSKGPSKALRNVLEDPSIVYLTAQLTRLYEVPVRFFGGKWDEYELGHQLERAKLHECVSRIDDLSGLHG